MSAASASTLQVAPRATSGSSVIEQTTAGLLPETDSLWQDVYHVIAPIAGTDGVQFWKANRTDTAEEVVLRVTAGAKGDSRSAVWGRLSTIEFTHLQRAREVHYSAGHRVEVYNAMRGTSLRAWRAARPSVDTATAESVVRQVSEALGVLHASGLVHLGLNPDVIFVREEKEGLHLILGGLESVTRFEDEKPIAALVDPFYAPPEAATLEFHEPGPSLCAWDWWSLGRVVQELILGHHVIDKLPGADSSQSAPVRAARAEELLLEGMTKGLRAGAVELMLGLDSRLDLLLRGLLASASEARWGGEFVDRWLRQKPVKELYTSPRIEQKFRWHGRLHTVPEAARLLQTAEHWAEAESHIFESGNAGTLARFISKSPEQAQAKLRLDDVLKKLAESGAMRGEPVAVVREVIVTVALLQLAGANLTWRGRRLNGESLRAMLAEDVENPERFALVRLFTHRSVTAQIDRNDFEAGRSLAVIGTIVGEAETILRQQVWSKGDDPKVRAEIFRLALEPDGALRPARERLQGLYACASQPSLEKIFKTPQPSRAVLVAFAWVEPTAAQRGFVTHAEWEAKQSQTLRARGEQLVATLFWARLGRALGVGPLLFGPLPGFIGCWAAVAILAAVLLSGFKGLLAAGAVVGLAVAIRAFAHVAVKSIVGRLGGIGSAWKWTDGVARCQKEMWAKAGGVDPAESEKVLSEVNAGLARLTLVKPVPLPVPPPPSFAGLRQAGFASWFLLVGMLAGFGWRAKVYPPAWARPADATEKTAAIKASIDAAEQAAAARAAEKTVVADIKVSWPYKPADGADTPTVTRTLEATKAQLDFARKHGRALVAPYKPETIGTLLMFGVPAGDEFGVMIFDGKKGDLVGDKVYVLAYRPLPRAWVQIGERMGVYLTD